MTVNDVSIFLLERLPVNQTVPASTKWVKTPSCKQKPEKAIAISTISKNAVDFSGPDLLWNGLTQKRKMCYGLASQCFRS